MSKKNSELNIIFAGTPDFAMPTLKQLITKNNITAVITQPDKKTGRKQKIVFSPIKQLALKYKKLILQPGKLTNKDFINQIKKLKPDLIIVAAYGKIIPKEILKIPKYGCINIHASLLPKYRGASPIQTAILNGDKQTGITIMQMNEKMDQGSIIAQTNEKIYNNDTAQTLHDRLANTGANLLEKTLPKYISQELKPQKQDHTKATYCKIINKKDGRINWQKTAKEIECKVRAFTPWPSAFTFINKKRYKIIKASANKQSVDYSEGTTFQDKDDIAIACKNSYLVIKHIQPEGKKTLASKAFLLGHKDILNQKAK